MPRISKKRADQQLMKKIKDGKLDGRTKEAQALRTMQAALEDDPKATSLKILRQDISINTLVGETLAAYILKHPDKFIDLKTGQINKDLANDLIKFQEQNRRAILALSQIAPADKDTVGNARAVLEAD